MQFVSTIVLCLVHQGAALRRTSLTERTYMENLQSSLIYYIDSFGDWVWKLAGCPAPRDDMKCSKVRTHQARRRTHETCIACSTSPRPCSARWTRRIFCGGATRHPPDSDYAPPRTRACAHAHAARRRILHTPCVHTSAHQPAAQQCRRLAVFRVGLCSSPRLPRSASS